jgi:hypothetical protein
VTRPRDIARSTRVPLLALLVATIGCPRTVEPPPPRPAPPPLETSELEAIAQEALATAARLRGLPLAEPPTVRILPPGAFVAERDWLAGSAVAGPTGDDLLVGLRAMAGLGMVAPGDVSTRGLASDQIGNFDCTENVIRVDDLRFLPPPAELADLHGAGPPGWRDLQVSVHAVLAHEAAHSLVWRAFDLPCPPSRSVPDRDAALALLALEEGDAEQVLDAVVRERAAPDSPDLELWLAPLHDLDAAEPPAGTDFLLRFPYEAGDRFVGALDRAGGNAARDEAYRSPPLSTEQVLHPERYFAGEAPALVTLPEFPDLRAAGYALSDAGTIGEAGIIAFLSALTDSIFLLLTEVLPVPEDLCEPPPIDCSGLTTLPGSRALPPGMSLNVELALPPLPPTALPTGEGEPTPYGGDSAAGGSAPPLVPTEDWSLRDSEGRLRAAAWDRILRAADGWRGDAAAFWLRPDQDVPGVIWASAWNDACEAEQFRRDVAVARPPWAVCRRGSEVYVVGGFPRAVGESTLRQLVAGTAVTDGTDRPSSLAYVPPPGRLEERPVAALDETGADGWPARADVPYSPTGPVVLRRYVDEQFGVVLPLPAGPYWRVLPAQLASALSRGVALERIGGGQLVVATIAAAAEPAVRAHLAAQGGKGEEVDCGGGPGWNASWTTPGATASSRLDQWLLVEHGDCVVVVVGWIAAGAAPESQDEFAAAFRTACGHS